MTTKNYPDLPPLGVIVCRTLDGPRADLAVVAGHPADRGQQLSNQSINQSINQLINQSINQNKSVRRILCIKVFFDRIPNNNRSYDCGGVIIRKIGWIDR